MKHLRILLAAALLAFSSIIFSAAAQTQPQRQAQAQAQDAKPLKVLAIGNSFSEDAVEHYLHPIAAADGVQLIIGNMYIGGCSLERHWNNAQSGSRDYQYRKIGLDGVKHNTKGVTLEEALKDEDWDVVTLQQCSNFSGMWESYEPYLPNLIEYIRTQTAQTTEAAQKAPAKQVKILFHQTWAYATGSTHGAFKDYGKSSSKMYERIIKASANACGKYGLGVIPSGTAIQIRRTNGLDNSITRDGFHLNATYGQYTAACVWYEVLTGRSAIGNTFRPAGTWKKYIEYAQQAAHNAVQSPFDAKNITLDEPATIYSEAEVPSYTLPDPLTCLDGSKVKNSRKWMKKRRPELLELFETEMYGKAPGRPADLHFKVLSEDRNALGGKAVRKEIAVYIDSSEKNPIMLLEYVPSDAKGPVPAFLGVNFSGNKYIVNDPGIKAPENYSRYGIFGNQDGSRLSSRPEEWDIEQILAAGYGLVTYSREDVDPDYDDAFQNGVHRYFYKEGQTYPEPDEWGTISAWAWGLSRALDYLETDPDIDATKVAVMGHSRLGKTALLAGARDPRFALVISNDSGCGGAALSRRRFGERLDIINRAFPHWFCGNFFKYSGHEEDLPFDQHELIALVAPRPVYVASASEDLWADPYGEFLSAKYASEVYNLFGYSGLENAEMPAPGERVWGDRVAYHLRQGPHLVTSFDWKNYIEFADKFLK